MIELKPHQIIPIEFIKDNFGLILYHSTGSGKTITSLVGMYQFDKEIIIIGPRSASKSFTDEINRLKYDVNRFTIYTLQKIKSILKLGETIFTNKCVIVDEAHHLKTLTKRNMAIHRALKYSHRVMLLTATPFINHLSDIAILVNIIKKEEVLPSDHKLFNFLYFNERKMQLENEQKLYDKLKNCISYYETNDTVNYPKGETIIKKVIMNDEQIIEYKKYIRKIIYEGKDTDADKDINLDIDFEDLENVKKNAFLSATRQLSNTMDGRIDTPKMIELFNIITTNKYPAVIYSNYLKNGIYPIYKILTANNISCQIITGGQQPEEMKNIVDSYNNGKLKVLLISSAGSESLDLKKTRQIHIMEPHWNEAKIKQVIGRAIRYKSHEGLKPEERNVKIFRWISVFGPPYKNLSADEYLTNISKKKEMVYNAFKKIIIDASIENIGKNQRGGYYYSMYIKNLFQYKKLINKN